MQLSDKTSKQMSEERVEFPRDKAKLQGSIAAEMQKWSDLAEARRRELFEQARTIEDLKAERDVLAEEAHAAVEQLADELQRRKTQTEPVAKPDTGWETGGLKYDSNKPRHDLIDPYAMEVLAKVLTFGAEKYATHNWRKGIAYSRLIAAALRHINAISAGTDLDEETGLPHAAQAMCCMMFLCWMQQVRTDMDDRWKSGGELKNKVKKVVFNEYPGVAEERQKATEHADAIFSQYGVGRHERNSGSV